MCAQRSQSQLVVVGRRIGSRSLQARSQHDPIAATAATMAGTAGILARTGSSQVTAGATEAPTTRVITSVVGKKPVLRAAKDRTIGQTGQAIPTVKISHPTR